MRTDLLDYPLPEEHIASRPATEREGARLLVVGAATLTHSSIRDWVGLVPAGALVVLNDTRVRRARVTAHKPTGGRVELLFLHRLEPDATLADEPGAEPWAVLAHANRPLAPGARLVLEGAELSVARRNSDGTAAVWVRAPGGVEALLERHGTLPLPPYLGRPADEEDGERYQTVFAREPGSAAAPTAGLHLSERMLGELRGRGVRLASLTLEVGAGTFLPVRSDDLDQHPMHEERFDIGVELAHEIASARARGAPVVAVGTTVVRALESASDAQRPGQVRACNETTRLLIQPGFRFRVVDALLTNFHAPRSTLLALVSAFIGHERCLSAYRSALDAGYRFLSYGDAMWIPERIDS
ncbi:MAG: tRNA preQ1(34) S-adenosylmethionine ribosyltransferase-isomerase QueA [Polyangiaceae bacterium]